jgi:hypothetical protein
MCGLDIKCFYLSLHLFASPSICFFILCLSLCLSISRFLHLSVFTSLCFTISMSLRLSQSISLPLHLSVFPFLCLSMSLSLHLSIPPSPCLSLCLSISLFFHLSDRCWDREMKRQRDGAFLCLCICLSLHLSVYLFAPPSSLPATAAGIEPSTLGWRGEYSTTVPLPLA